MATERTTIRYTNFDGLINSNTSDFLMKDSEVVAAKNVWTYQLGKLEKVPGYELAASNQIVSGEGSNFLHWYFDTATRTDYLLSTSTEGSDLTMQYIAPNADTPVTTWTVIDGISTSWDTYADSLPDMENYLGKAFITGYKSGTTFLPNATVSGTTFSTTDSDITDMPQGKFIVRYRDLLYVLHAKTGGDVYPSRAYYSDEPTAGAIGWTNLATNFIEFGYDDGDEITGAVETLDRLIVFKQRSMWKYDETEIKKIADYGCDSYRSIVKVNNILYWFNRYGFWRWRGAQPELISAKVQNYIDAIDQTALSDVVATEFNGFEYRAFIGDITIDDVIYNNAWFCWDTRKENCYIRCTFDDVKSTSLFKVDSKVRSYFANDDGYVFRFGHKVDNIYSDNGNEIDSFFVTQAYDHGAPEDTKYTNHMTVFANNAQNLKCAVDINKNKSFNNANIVHFDKHIGHADLISTGNRYRYKFYEKSGNKSWEFEGFTISTDIKEHEE
jgi:hypothetical protein